MQILPACLSPSIKTILKRRKSKVNYIVLIDSPSTHELHLQSTSLNLYYPSHLLVNTKHVTLCKKNKNAKQCQYKITNVLQ